MAIGTQIFTFYMGTKLLKFYQYPVPSGTLDFYALLGTGQYPGTHGYKRNAHADPWLYQ